MVQPRSQHCDSVVVFPGATAGITANAPDPNNGTGNDPVLYLR